MLVEVKVCDVCKRVGVPAVRYAVSSEDGRSAETDRCEEHAEPFEAILNRGTPAPAKEASPKKKAPARKAVGRPRSRTRVMTVEEIDREKADKAAGQS